MTDILITQEAVEALAEGSTALQITQEAVEALSAEEAETTPQFFLIVAS